MYEKGRDVQDVCDGDLFCKQPSIDIFIHRKIHPQSFVITYWYLPLCISKPTYCQYTSPIVPANNMNKCAGISGQLLSVKY